jgi:hypothetical protein
VLAVQYWTASEPIECAARNICFRNTESNDFALLKFNDLERSPGGGFWNVFN